MHPASRRGLGARGWTALTGFAGALVAIGGHGWAERGLAAVFIVAALAWSLKPRAALVGDDREAAPRRPGLPEAAALGLASLWIGVRAAALPLRDQPVGTDALRYLKNALALAGDGQGYQNWRAPLQGWLSLALTPVAGWLVEASQLLSWLSMTALPALAAALGWELGGRSHRGAAAGVGGALLLAAWPDLQLYARSSTPYPLLAALLLAATLVLARLPRTGASGAAPAGAPDAAGAEGGSAGGGSGGVGSSGGGLLRRALRPGPLALGLGGGVLLGLARATDLRGGPWAASLLLALALGALLDAPRGRRLEGLARVAAPLLLAGVVTAALSAGLLALLPVELLPLSRQVGLQSDLNASSANPLCRVGGGELPPLVQIVGACGWSTLTGNLGRAGAAAPLGLGALALLGLVGLARGSWTRRLVLLAPVVLAGPSLLVVAAQHRYLLPLAPAAALVFADALLSLLGTSLGALDGPWPKPPPASLGAAALRMDTPSVPRPALGLRLLGVLAFCVVLATNPESLLARAQSGRSAGGGTVAVLGAPRGLTLVRAELRRELRDGERVYDCARGDLDLRVYPHPVVEPERAGCKALLRGGPPAGEAAWLLAPSRPGEPVSPAWLRRAAFPRGPEQVGLWYAGPQSRAEGAAGPPPDAPSAPSAGPRPD